MLEFSYDGLERLVSQNVNPDGNGSADATFSYGANAGPDLGRLKSVSSITDYTYWYDLAGRVLYDQQVTPGTSSTFTFNSSYTYDALDRIKTRRFPDASDYVWSYDGPRLTRIANANPNALAVPLSAASYDALGRPLELKLGERMVSSAPKASARIAYTFDAQTSRLARIEAIANPDQAATSALDITAAFDGLGRLTSQRFAGESDRTYTYDGLGRLETARGPWQASTFTDWTHTYDPLGNLRSLSGPGYNRTWSYGDTTRPRVLTAFTESGGTSDTNDTDLEVDGAGNLRTRRRNGGGLETLRWNAQNRLYTIEGTPGGEQFSLSYDAFGRRVRQQITGGATPTEIFYVGDDFEYDKTLVQANLFFFLDGQRIASFASFGNYYSYSGVWPALDEWTRRLGPPLAGLGALLGAAGIAALASRRRRPAWLGGVGAGVLGGGLLLLPFPASPGGGGSGPSTHGSHGEIYGVYYLPDHLGSTRAVVNLYGAVVETRDYDPWGRSIAHTGDFKLKHRFTGQPVAETEVSSSFGLQNYGARFYDPKWGRFVSSDEVTEGFDSQGINSFAYVRNRPSSNTDPTGNFISADFTSLSSLASMGWAFSSAGSGSGTEPNGKIQNRPAFVCDGFDCFEIDDTAILALPAGAVAGEVCGELCALAAAGLIIAIKIYIDEHGKIRTEGVTDDPFPNPGASTGAPNSPPLPGGPTPGGPKWKIIVVQLLRLLGKAIGGGEKGPGGTAPAAGGAPTESAPPPTSGVSR